MSIVAVVNVPAPTAIWCPTPSPLGRPQLVHKRPPVSMIYDTSCMASWKPTTLPRRFYYGTNSGWHHSSKPSDLYKHHDTNMITLEKFLETLWGRWYSHDGSAMAPRQFVGARFSPFGFERKVGSSAHCPRWTTKGNEYNGKQNQQQSSQFKRLSNTETTLLEAILWTMNMVPHTRYTCHRP